MNKPAHHSHFDIKVALVQYPLGEGFSKKQFFEKVEGYVREAVGLGADLVVFPELLTTEIIEWTEDLLDMGRRLQRLAVDFAPEYADWLGDLAQTFGVYLLGGSTPRWIEGQVINSAVFANPKGQLEYQDKLFLTPNEVRWNFSTGNTLRLFETPLGRMAINVCFDCEFPIVSQSLATVKPELVLIPSWTSSTQGLRRVDWAARSRAIEHFAFVLKVATAQGAVTIKEHVGQSNIIFPQDDDYFPEREPTSQLNAPELLMGTVDLAVLRARRIVTDYFPALIQQRQFPEAVGSGIKTESIDF